MLCPSRRDVLRSSGLAVAAAVAGCSGAPAPSEPASPTPAETATRTSTPTEEPTETATRKTDCKYTDIYLSNETGQRFHGSLRIVEAGDDRTDEEGEEVFSGSFRLTAYQGKSYSDVPDRNGRHRIYIDLEDGPSGTGEVQGYDWEENRLIWVDIRSDSIQFSNRHVDGC